MSTTSALSRHSIMTAVASLGAAAAVPAFAATAVEAAPALAQQPITPAELTPIGNMWIEAVNVDNEYKAHRRLCERLENVLEERMPEPHPSIVWGTPENDADGLAYFGRGEPPYFKRYIFSGWIEGKLEASGNPRLTKTSFSKDLREQIVTVISRNEDDPFPFTEEDLALRDRLAARLDLSRRYEREMKQMKRKIGLAQAERKRDRACGRWCKITAEIFRTPAANSGDLAIKIAIYESFDRDAGGDEIVSDVQRLLKASPTFLAVA
jgi:hypothetical protein